MDQRRIPFERINYRIDLASERACSPASFVNWGTLLGYRGNARRTLRRSRDLQFPGAGAPQPSRTGINERDFDAGNELSLSLSLATTPSSRIRVGDVVQARKLTCSLSSDAIRSSRLHARWPLHYYIVILLAYTALPPPRKVSGKIAPNRSEEIGDYDRESVATKNGPHLSSSARLNHRGWTRPSRRLSLHDQ